MKSFIVLLLALLPITVLVHCNSEAKPIEGEALKEKPPLRIFIRAGEKTHRPGAHDHPRFLADWKKMLQERGAVVDGAQVFPTAEQIKSADVIIFYAANAGNINPAERKLLDAFQKRGGGLVFIHDAVCGNDAQWFKKVTGGAWEHGHSKFYEGDIDIDYTEQKHPITKDAVDFKLTDEIYYDLHMLPESKILACTQCAKAPGSPQIWSLETGKSRTFTCIPGHWYSTFEIPQFKAMLLRGIAWAGHREVDSFTTPEEIKVLKKPMDYLKNH